MYAEIEKNFDKVPLRNLSKPGIAAAIFLKLFKEPFFLLFFSKNLNLKSFEGIQTDAEVKNFMRHHHKKILPTQTQIYPVEDILQFIMDNLSAMSIYLLIIVLIFTFNYLMLKIKEFMAEVHNTWAVSSCPLTRSFFDSTISSLPPNALESILKTIF